jgi:hypothetical protein
MTSDPTKITSKWVANQVITEEHYHIVQSRGTATAFFSKAQKGKPTQGNSDIRCSYCKKKGHKKAECYKLKKEKEEAAVKASNTAGTSSSSSMPWPSTNSASLSNATAKVAISSSNLPPYDQCESDVVHLFHAIAIP